MPLNARQTELCEKNTTDFSGLKAVTVNCTLKRQEDRSHTRLLLSVAEKIMTKSGVAVERVQRLPTRSPTESTLT